LVPAVAIDAVMMVTDRFLLERYVSLRDLGLYSVGDQLGSVVRMVSVALKTTWVPFEMRTAVERPHDAPRIIARMATYFAAAGAVVGLAVAALSADGVFLIGVEKYQPVAGLVPLFVMPHMVAGSLALLGGGLGIARQTQYAWPMALIHLIVVVVGNVLLIPVLGLYGAILCSLLGFLVRSLLLYVLSQRFYPIPFEWPKIACWLGGALCVYAAAAAVPIAPSLPGLIVRGSLVAAYAVAGGYFILDGRAFLRGRGIANCGWRISN
jgi:O-antigen/teichoic acid export membrane protein